MRPLNRFLIVLVVACLIAGLTTQSGMAQGKNPLPALPDPAVVAKIIAETGGPTFEPLGVPAPILDQLLSIARGLGTNLSFDVNRAVYYFGFDGSLRRIVVPVAGSAEAALQPDIATPENLPARAVSGVFEVGRGAAVLVVTWKDADKTKKPAEARFYALSGGVVQFSTPYKVSFRRFKGDRTSKVAPNDRGAIIAARETCFTVGLDQVCYGPDRPTPDSQAAAGLDDGTKTTSRTYDVRARFDRDGALPDLLGASARAACAASLSRITSLDIGSLPECAANMLFSGVERLEAGQPIGLIRLLRPVDLRAYDPGGNPVGMLPPGDYLLLDATPGSGEPGAPDVLFLVNADGANHYLIPSLNSESFGDSTESDKQARRAQAGIKDANVGFHDF